MLIEYQLRIRDASTALHPDGTTDALALTSVPAGTNPYISAPPGGDGAEFDPITGAVREGSYTVRVVDPATGSDATGTIRLITSQLEDAGYRQQLLSRRCYVESRVDGGAWTTLTAGYLSAIRLVSAIEYEFAIGDSRRIGRTRQIFEGGLPSYGARGTIIGGPIVNGDGSSTGFLGVRNRGGWRFRVAQVTGNQIACDFVDGYPGPTGKTTTKLLEAIPTKEARGSNAVSDITAKYRTDQKIFNTLFTPYDGLRLAVVGNAGLHRVREACSDGDSGISYVVNALTRSGAVYIPALDFIWDTTLGGAVPAVGTVLSVHLYADKVAEDSPLYIDLHPVDLLTQLWTDHGIPYDAVTAAAVRARIGADVRLALRITAPQALDGFIDTAIFAPFGISARWNTSGQLELFTTRLKDTATPALTINTADLRSGDPVVFDLSEDTVVTGVTVAQQLYATAPDSTADTAQPRDGILVSTQRVSSSSADTTAFGTKEVTIEIPGMVHLASSRDGDIAGLVAATALELFDRFGRGAPSGEVELLVTAAAAAAKLGDEIYVQAPHYPNRNYRIGESSVGARIMQLVRRTESPEGPRFKLVDAGLAQQPVTPAAVVTIAGNAQEPRTVAEFTITNAAAINATGVLSVAVEWATGTGSPTTNGQDFARYAAGACPTTAVPLPTVTAGTKVWMRARTEQAGRRPAAWTAWTSVTLSSTSAPSGLGVSAIKQTAVTLTWTNGIATDDVEVFVYEGAAPPADWGASRVARLPAGSTRTIVRSLTGPGVTYQVAVCHITSGGTRSAFATNSFATNSTLDGCPRPAGFFVMANREDVAARSTGIALALWAADTTIDLAIERAPDSGGSPGTWAEVARVPGTTTVIVDQLPSDGATYWYRVRHSLGGLGDSAYTAAQSGTPGGIPEGLVRPPAVDPIIEIADTESGTTGTTTLTVTDPQGRVMLVEFRTQTDPGAWSAWTPDASVPYQQAVTIPTGSGLWGRIGYRVTGYDALGTERTLAAGTETFDLNKVSNLVVIDVSFSHDGVATVKVTGDSDTQSVRCAVAATGYPTSGTVSAATAQNGRQVEFAFAGPYNVGTTLYCSAIGYSELAGVGVASDKMDFKQARDGQDIRVQEKLSESGTTGTVQLITTDPNGRISNWEYRTQVGRGAWSAWGAMTNTSPNNYEASVAMGEKVPSKIGWRIIGTSLTGQVGVGLFENVVTFAMGPVPMEPVVEAAVLGDGTVNVSVIGDSDTASIQVGYSTVSAAAADAALGGTVNARQNTFVNVGSGSLTLGQRAYISVKAWSATGASGSGSVIVQVQVARFNSADTIKSRVPAAAAIQPSTENDTFGRGTSDYAPGPNGTGAGVSGYHYGLFLVPRGVTLRALRVQGYCAAASDVLTAKFYRVDAGGSSTQLGATQTLTGGGAWTALAVTSLSEDTTDRAYVVQLQAYWNSHPGPPSSLLCSYLEAEYDKTAVTQNI